MLKLFIVHVFFILVLIGLVTIPMQHAKVSSGKPVEGMIAKTIHLTPAQMVR